MVECGGLENRYPARDLGFESLPLRQTSIWKNLLTLREEIFPFIQKSLAVALLGRRPKRTPQNDQTESLAVALLGLRPKRASPFFKRIHYIACLRQVFHARTE